MLTVHTHFHARRTGVTAHVESIVKGQGTRVFGYGLSPQTPTISFSKLLAAARAGPLVLHTHRNNEILFALLLRLFFAQVRIVATRHSGRPPGWFSRVLLSRVNALVVLNSAQQRQFDHSARVIPHGVELSRFSPALPRDEARRALGLPAGPLVGIVGRVRLLKGQGDFIDAFVPLLERFPQWTPVFFGRIDPIFRDWFDGLVKRTGGRLIHAGEITDVQLAYRALDLVVQPSREEAFSMVTLEALASGCCVIASELPDVNTVVLDEKTGFLFPPGDADALRTLLERLFQDPTRDEVGKRAAEDARARLGVDTEARTLLELYAEVAK